MASTSSVAARSAGLEPRRAALGVAVGLGLAAIAFDNGGYFPTAWSWGALVALTAIAAALALGESVRPSGLALAALAGIASFAAWTWLALLWSDDRAATVLEGQRTLLYVAALGAFVLLVRRSTAPVVLAATLVAVFLASGYGLVTRLFPERLGVFDPVAAYRLEEPLTYWNALGIFAAMGALIALGFAARGRTLVGRAIAGATLPLLFSTVYFTFSRGSWLAAGIGIGLAFAVDPRRLQLVLAALVLAPTSALAVLLSSRQDALTRIDAPLAAASHDGHRLALILLLLAAASALVPIGLALVERRVVPPRRARLAFAAALVLVGAAFFLAAFVRYGGPVTLVRKGYDAFTTTSEEPTVNLNKRLFTFSGSYRSELWHAAWDDYRDRSVLGSGPGTYEQYWNAHRPIPHKVRDAHNLYLEVLAELGPVGLLLLLLALGTPLVAAIRARDHPLAPLALAAYVAFLVHAAVDWDWEMTAVTLAALACAAALLAAADRRDVPPPLAPRVRISAVVVALALAVVAFVGVVGASALAASDRALAKGRYDEAATQAHKAARWWRWSPDPWRQLGDVEAARGDEAAASRDYTKAISKDRRDWKLWYDLSTVSSGAEARNALAQARRLNRFGSSDFEGADNASR
ncbi:MAG: O-antigen ligase family protein [Actinomycetota bacterium]